MAKLLRDRLWNRSAYHFPWIRRVADFVCAFGRDESMHVFFHSNTFIIVAQNEIAKRQASPNQHDRRKKKKNTQKFYERTFQLVGSIELRRNFTPNREFVLALISTWYITFPRCTNTTQHTQSGFLCRIFWLRPNRNPFAWIIYVFFLLCIYWMLMLESNVGRLCVCLCVVVSPPPPSFTVGHTTTNCY